MFLKIRNYKIVSIVFVLFAIGFFYSGVTNAGVVETNMDFSEVDVGSTATGVLHITTLVPGLYAELSFGTCSCGGTPFTIETTEIYIGTPNTTVDVEVYFTPSSPGECSAVLYVFYGRDWEEVQVTGTGIGITTQQTSTMSLLDYFDQAVTDGLVGSGPGKSADKRLNALRNMIRVADDLIESGDMDGACGKLKAIYKKIDGEEKPQDFAKGPGLDGLRGLVQEAMGGCQ